MPSRAKDFSSRGSEASSRALLCFSPTKSRRGNFYFIAKSSRRRLVPVAATTAYSTRHHGCFGHLRRRLLQLPPLPFRPCTSRLVLVLCHLEKPDLRFGRYLKDWKIWWLVVVRVLDDSVLPGLVR
ncbi:hypothetical protein PR202_ga26452 [Eleusine coracana subsp. coracana]|uniref:Uncharacterized protein n=1 Tax=Eleusine coracana subsp. coracana TaxID=191504 RepID=A0AAV5DE60_ELECO|nr:hypothetical protein PR202_ga26452 [Eleusine coracana subsp. coracana]